jgi:hypothetical protein
VLVRRANVTVKIYPTLNQVNGVKYEQPILLKNPEGLFLALGRAKCGRWRRQTDETQIRSIHQLPLDGFAGLQVQSRC